MQYLFGNAKLVILAVATVAMSPCDALARWCADVPSDKLGFNYHEFEFTGKSLYRMEAQVGIHRSNANLSSSASLVAPWIPGVDEYGNCNGKAFYGDGLQRRTFSCSFDGGKSRHLHLPKIYVRAGSGANVAYVQLCGESVLASSSGSMKWVRSYNN